MPVSRRLARCSTRSSLTRTSSPGVAVLALVETYAITFRHFQPTRRPSDRGLPTRRRPAGAAGRRRRVLRRPLSRSTRSPSARAGRRTPARGGRWPTSACSAARPSRTALGLGLVEAALVFEQLGRHLVGGPILWTTLAASARRRRGRRRRACVAGVEVGAVVDGPLVVEHAAESRRAARAPRRRRRSLIERPTSPPPEELEPLDPLTPVGRVRRRCPSGDGSAAPTRRRPAAGRGHGADRGACCVGVARGGARRRPGLRARARAVRRGRSASFQALKHMMADMFVRTSLARSATYAAAAVLDDPAVGHGDARSVGAAKLLAGEAAHRERPGRGPGARRHGLHLGDAPALPAQAGVGARALLRHRRRPRPARRCRSAVRCVTDDDRRATDSVCGRRPSTTCCAIVLDRPAREELARRRRRCGRIVEALEDGGRRPTRLAAIVITSSAAATSAPAPTVVATNSADEPTARATGQASSAGPPMQAHRLIELIVEIQLPVVCAVRGWAAGLGLPAGAGRRLHGRRPRRARFWEPFCAAGSRPDSGATWFLPRLVGVARAKELLMLGRELSGPEAAEWGLILRCRPRRRARRRVGALVDRPGQPRHGRARADQALRSTGRSRLGLTEAMEAEVDGAGAVARAPPTSARGSPRSGSVGRRSSRAGRGTRMHDGLRDDPLRGRRPGGDDHASTGPTGSTPLSPAMIARAAPGLRRGRGRRRRVDRSSSPATAGRSAPAPTSARSPTTAGCVYDEPYLSTLPAVGGAAGGHAAVPHDDQADPRPRSTASAAAPASTG